MVGVRLERPGALWILFWDYIARPGFRAGLFHGRVTAPQTRASAPRAGPRATAAPTDSGGNMKPKRLPSAIYLRSILRYEPETGRLYWRQRYDVPAAWNTWLAGRLAGCIRGGRRVVRLPGYKLCAAYRIIWKMMRGREPPEIDHINGNPLDDRLVNLRAATRRQNAQSSRGSNPSGFKGVSFERKRWRARLCLEGQTLDLGSYADPVEAHAAYMQAARKHFGKFARASCSPPRRARRRR
jgi:hypothetical protein